MALVYKRGNTWWVRFRINGHHIRRSARTTRKAEAVAFLQRLLDEYAAKARGDQPRHRYVDAVERFQEASIKPKTRTCYQSSARACETVFGALHLDEIDRRAIAEFVSARKRSGLTDTTVRRDLAFLSSLCTLAVRWGWLDTNPVTTFSKRSLKEARPRTRFLTSPEFEHLLATASENLRPALILAVETGLRREELFGLTTADIDLGKREIHLEQTKTNSPRRVPMSDTAMVTVRDLLRAPGDPVLRICCVSLTVLVTVTCAPLSHQPAVVPRLPTSAGTTCATHSHHGSSRVVVISTISAESSATRPSR